MNFFLTGLFCEDLALIGADVLCPVLFLNVVLAIFTLIGLSTTSIYVINPNFDFENLVTPLTLLWLHLTSFFVVAEGDSRCRVGTVLALNWLVSCGFVLLSIRLGHHVATLATLVVVAGAPDLMHAELTHFDGSLASRAHFCFFPWGSFSHFTFILSLLNYKSLQASSPLSLTFQIFS